MSDHEILLRWLATAAARMSWSRRIRDLGRFACALVALRLLAEVLEIFGVPTPVLSAVAPLLIIAALALVALFTWRLARPTTQAQAAGAADTRAGLKDELKSAHWFAHRAAQDAFVEILLARAVRTVQTQDARRLFPLAVPRSVPAALALAILTGALAWFAPRMALPVTQASPTAPAPAARGNAGQVADGEKKTEKIAAEPAASDVVARHNQEAAWLQLEQMTKALPEGAEKEATRRAVAARDTRLAAQLAQAVQRAQSVAAALNRPAQPEDTQLSEEAALKILEALRESGAKEERQGPSETAGTAPAARVRQGAREKTREEERKLHGQPAQGDVALNNRLRALSRNSVNMREVAYAEGEAAEAGSRVSVEGAAVGDRAGRSRSGGSEGEQPYNGPVAADATQPVLGEATARLLAQLQGVRVQRGDDPQRQETEEAFYAATQRQVSRVGYESLTAQWRTQREGVLAPSRTPLAYRDAVKRYFLTQHGKEE